MLQNALKMFVLAGALLWASISSADEPKPQADTATADRQAGGNTDAAAKSPSAEPRYENVTVRGRVVWLADALSRRYGVRTVTEAAERVLVVETPKGELHPIVEDIRGRSFRRDKRLRNVDVELNVRRYEGAPLVQVMRVYALEEKGKFELDYWCEICAIAMFELKVCDCCQGPIELRRRKVDSKQP